MDDATEVDPLHAARTGDRVAFEGLVSPFQRQLLVHCYRLTGTLQDAEDIVQETLVRAWQRLATFQARGSFRAWLYRIATNACLDLLDRPERRFAIAGPTDHPLLAFKPVDGETIEFDPLPDAWLSDLDDCPEARYTIQESVAIAFLTALRVLPPRQRVVLLMRDVFGWPAGEVGEMLGLSLSSVHSLLHRARLGLEREQARGNSAEWRPAPDDEATRALLDRYVRAWEEADLDAFIALFKEEVVVTMPPERFVLTGRTALRAFAALNAFYPDRQEPVADPARGRWWLLPTRANAQPALAVYRRSPGESDYRYELLFVLAAANEQIESMTVFRTLELAHRLGLPTLVPAAVAVP